MSKPNLTLLKKLVTELEAQLDKAEADRAAGADPHSYITELSKAAGVAMTITTESTALVGDMAQLINASSSPKPDALSKLVGILGGGNLPGTN